MTRQQTYRTLLPVGKTNWLQGFAGVNKTSPNVKTKIIQKLTGHCPGTYGFKLSYHLVGKGILAYATVTHRPIEIQALGLIFRRLVKVSQTANLLRFGVCREALEPRDPNNLLVRRS